MTESIETICSKKEGKTMLAEINLFRFHGPDSRSDNGYWEIIVAAKDGKVARRIAEEHLKEVNPRLKLDRGKAEELSLEIGVVHSTVQS